MHVPAERGQFNQHGMIPPPRTLSQCQSTAATQSDRLNVLLSGINGRGSAFDILAGGNMPGLFAVQRPVGLEFRQDANTMIDNLNVTLASVVERLDRIGARL